MKFLLHIDNVITWIRIETKNYPVYTDYAYIQWRYCYLNYLEETGDKILK
jgi:hypothetical protein